ncbi:MAG TPA: dCTP deaminase [Pirellulales bacterium]|nr:dCTP deaminase [Pirellulales bacterium]
MILKAERIADLLRQGEHSGTVDPLVITPRPDPDAIEATGAASIDLRLGTWFMTLRQSRMTHLSIDDSLPSSQLTKTHFVSFGNEYVLHPGNFVLSVTLEWMRIPKDLAAYVIGRSSWGRRGLIIATATGVHPGFTGCLTLELSNLGELPIAIKPGMGICQLFFHRVEQTGKPQTDASQFIGLRKPTVGRIELDVIASACRKIRLARIFPATFGKNLREDGNLSQPGV